MNRDLLAAEAEGYRKGRALAINEMEAVSKTLAEAAYREGREDQKRVQRNWQRAQYVAITLPLIIIGVLIAAALWNVANLL